MRQLDIGVISYKNSELLRQTLESITAKSVTDHRIIVVHNPTDEQNDRACKMVAQAFGAEWHCLDVNIGYAGGMNHLMQLSTSEYFCYCDNDVIVQSHGWDEALAQVLDRFHEVGMVFPNGGAYPIDRLGKYQEVLWSPGFCFMLSRRTMDKVGGFDAELGHQEEADYAQRVRMEGLKCAALTQVHVKHMGTNSSDPKQRARVDAGVVKWVNKWVAYFCGTHMNYHSENVLRFEDWPPNALYLEEYWKCRLGELNVEPKTVRIDGREYDLIQVPRLSGFYRGRIV